MKKFMLGKKAGMTQIFDSEGSAVPVTVIECGPVTVLQNKTEEIDGYRSVKVGFQEKKQNRTNKPDKGQFEKAGVDPKKTLREFKVSEDQNFELGQVINCAEMFEVGERVDVSGVSKGKGFQGNVKRHNQKGGREAHGSKYHRRVGSLGSSATPGRTMPGTKLPGQMGNKNVTVQNLEIVMVDGERNIMAIKGALPGSNGSVIEVREAVSHKSSRTNAR